MPTKTRFIGAADAAATIAVLTWRIGSAAVPTFASLPSRDTKMALQPTPVASSHSHPFSASASRSRNPGLQAIEHVPALHDATPPAVAHLVSHPPQCMRSLVRSAQTPEHAVAPPSQCGPVSETEPSSPA